MMVIGSKSLVGAAALAVFLTRALPCLSFQTPVRGTGRDRFLLSSVTEEPTPEISSFDPEAVQLKDDLVALAAATRRGVS